MTAGEGQKKTVVCLGDSITEGFGLTEETSYPTKLQHYLGEDFTVYNQGVCCANVIELEMEGRFLSLPYRQQERYREGLSRKGDVYVILLGTNDAQDGLDDVEDVTDPYLNVISHVELFVPCYQKILDDIVATNPNAQIYMGLPAPVSDCIWRRHQEKYLQKILPLLEGVAAQNEKVHLIDIHQAFLNLPMEERVMLYSEDGLHPNEKGADLIAQTVAKELLS